MDSDLAVKIQFFVNNNTDKHGTEFCGKRVHNPVDLLEKYHNELILITCGQSDEVRKQLVGYGLDENKIFVPDIVVLDLNITSSDFEFIWKNIDCFSMVYDMLEDERAKQVLVNILNYKIAHFPELIREIADSASEQYFDRDLIKFSKRDIF